MERALLVARRRERTAREHDGDSPVVVGAVSVSLRLGQEEVGLLAMTEPGLGVRQMGKAGGDPTCVVAGPEELEG